MIDENQIKSDGRIQCLKICVTNLESGLPMCTNPYWEVYPHILGLILVVPCGPESKQCKLSISVYRS